MKMRLLTRFAPALVVGVAALIGSAWMAPALALTPEERAALDLSAYTVKDVHKGYLDVGQRRQELQQTGDKILLKQVKQVTKLDACTASTSVPVATGATPIPGFYDDRDGWRKAVEPFHEFEDTVSQLAAQQVIAPDAGAGKCLLDMLDRWAAGGGLLSVDVKTSGLQAWFQVESTLFAAAFGYSVVRDEVPGEDAVKQRIEKWLLAAAENHLRYPGAKDGTCCNNHFYRRALYATIIGVLTDNNDLFRIGISAVYSALADASPQGALRLEMLRHQYAARYQAYATMYLVFIAELASRQGYDLYDIKGANGRSLGDIVDFALAALLQPESVADASATPHQDTSFFDDDQYFSWLELLGREPRWHDAVQALLAPHRPAYNRSLGGYMTLFFLPTAAK